MVKKILIVKKFLDACKKANCEEFIKKFPNGVNEINWRKRC